MDEWVLQIDENVCLWINSRHFHPLDIFFFWISSRIVWVPFYCTLLYALFAGFGWRAMLVGGLLAGLAVGLSDQISADLIRPFVERLRPAHPENPISPFIHTVSGYRSGRFGFPSCHASNSFALATITTFIFKRWQFTVSIFFWAVLVSYSRLYLGVHYPGDILVGWIIGGSSAVGVYALSKVVAKHLDRKGHKSISEIRFLSPEPAERKEMSKIHVNLSGKRFELYPTLVPVLSIFASIIVIGLFTIKLF